MTEPADRESRVRCENAEAFSEGEGSAHAERQAEVVRHSFWCEDCRFLVFFVQSLCPHCRPQPCLTCHGERELKELEGAAEALGERLVARGVEPEDVPLLAHCIRCPKCYDRLAAEERLAFARKIRARAEERTVPEHAPVGSVARAGEEEERYFGQLQEKLREAFPSYRDLTEPANRMKAEDEGWAWLNRFGIRRPAGEAHRTEQREPPHAHIGAGDFLDAIHNGEKGWEWLRSVTAECEICGRCVSVSITIVDSVPDLKSDLAALARTASNFERTAARVDKSTKVGLEASRLTAESSKLSVLVLKLCVLVLILLALAFMILVKVIPLLVAGGRPEGSPVAPPSARESPSPQGPASVAAPRYWFRFEWHGMDPASIGNGNLIILVPENGGERLYPTGDSEGSILICPIEIRILPEALGGRDPGTLRLAIRPRGGAWFPNQPGTASRRDDDSFEAILPARFGSAEWPIADVNTTKEYEVCIFFADETALDDADRGISAEAFASIPALLRSPVYRVTLVLVKRE